MHDHLRCKSRWRAAATFAVVIAALAAPGCAAFKATQQPSKKKLNVLTPGTPRSHVIAELGAPLWSEENDGKRVDIFAFKQGYTKGAKAGRALLHGAADVVTGGLWEVVGIPAESLADGSDVKVEVTYDASRAVRRVEVIEGEDVLHPRHWWQRKPKPDTRPSTAPGEVDAEDVEIGQATASGA